MGTEELKSAEAPIGQSYDSGQKKIILEYFPQEYLDLQQELVMPNGRCECHPKLVKILARINAEDIDMKLAHIAAYCEVAMDETYTLEDRMNLCVILKKRLVELREEPRVIDIIWPAKLEVEEKSVYTKLPEVLDVESKET